MIERVSPRVSSPITVGRAAESDRLLAAYELAASHATTVIVAGEAGVGKTRLLEDLQATVRARGGALLAGACIDLGDHGVPFAPFIDGLRALARERPDGLDAALGPDPTELWRLLPGRTGLRREPDDDQLGQARLFEQVLALLDQLGRETPVLVVLEDLHWADRSTRDLVRFLAHALRDERICMVLSYRSDDLHRRHPLMPVLADLARSPRVETLSVGRLGRDDTVALVASITGDGGRAVDGAAMYERSEGNPFFVEELVAARSEDPDALVPASIRETLTVRIARLPAETQDLLGIASIVGRRVDHELLEALAGLSTAAVVERIRPAVDAHIVLAEADPSAYVFRHALVGETSYDELLPAVRTGLHTRVAELLEERVATGYGPTPSQAEIAHHWERAHRPDRALRASSRAADEAAALVAHADVRAQLERVLALWPSVPDAAAVVGSDRGTVVQRAADAAAATGDYARAIALGSAVLSELDVDADPDRWLAAIRRMAWYHWDSGDAVGAEAVMAGGQRALEAATPEARVLYLVDMAMVHWSAGRFVEQARVVEEALGITGVESDIALATARAMHGVAMLSIGHFTSGLAEIEEATATPESLTDEPGQMPSVWLTHALGVGGWNERAVIAGYAGLDHLRKNGLARRIGPYLVANQADPLFELGRWDESLALMEGVEVQSLDSRAMPWIFESIAEIAARRGDTVRAATVLAAAKARTTVRDAIPDQMWLHRTIGAVALAEGRLRDARAAFRTAIELSPDPTHDRPLALWVIADALTVEADIAELARSRSKPAGPEDRAWADYLFGIAEVIAAESVDETAPGIRLFVAAAHAERLRFEGRWDVPAWTDVVAAADAAGQAPDAAWARSRLAEAILVVDRDRVAAGVLLRTARSVALELREQRLLARIDRLAASARVNVTDPATVATTATTEHRPSSELARLSPREREVLALVAAGRTNRDIADALFISEKTASVHVTHILDKLGVSSRVEAALVAVRDGLVATSAGEPRAT
jgi:DNA-binding CsgD family transcriptional regulator/tetratricopeptide (TPR) repeat protein